MPMKEARAALSGNHHVDTEVVSMAHAMFDRIRQIKRANPGVARNVDRLEREIRDRLQGIRNNIDKLHKEDRDLVSILIINGLQRTAEEVLAD